MGQDKLLMFGRENSLGPLKGIVLNLSSGTMQLTGYGVVAESSYSLPGPATWNGQKATIVHANGLVDENGITFQNPILSFTPRQQ